MKKLLFLLVSVFFLQIALAGKSTYDIVKAEESYLRVITEDTPFFKDKECKEFLFYLPYTYYVKPLNQYADSVHVEITGNNLTAIDGYVPNGFLFFDGLAVISPYPELSVYSVDTAIIYSDLSLSSPISYVFSKREMKYYGTYKTEDGDFIYYVSYNNKLGYVKEYDVYPFSIANHQNPLTFIQEEEEPVKEKPVKKANSSQTSLRIIIISCLALASITGIAFIIKRKPKKQIPTQSYYDENEYE